MHSGIICSDIPMRCIQGTIQYSHVRVGNGSFYTGLHKGWSGGKYKVASGVYGVRYQGIYVFLCPVFIENSTYFIGEGLFQVETSQLMSIGPGGSAGRFLIDEGSFQVW